MKYVMGTYYSPPFFLTSSDKVVSKTARHYPHRIYVIVSSGEGVEERHVGK